MKKIIFLLLMATTLAAYSQQSQPTNVLSTVNTVKPKFGQKMAFEASYKLHVAKFHKAEEKLNVYEILSGDYAGYYHLVNGERSFADFDKERSDANAHSLDLDKNFFPLLEDTRNGTYRFVDSLSLRPQVEAEKFVVTVRHLKQTINMGDYTKELARGVKVLNNLKGDFFENLSFAFFEQLWDGSDQVTVTIRNLKDGFKSLENRYFADAPPGTPSFRDEYVKQFGHTAWDERIKVMDTAVEKTEQYIMKLRKDLSSQ
jgi:hypothetical protein